VGLASPGIAVTSSFNAFVKAAFYAHKARAKNKKIHLHR